MPAAIDRETSKKRGTYRPSRHGGRGVDGGVGRGRKAKPEPPPENPTECLTIPKPKSKRIGSNRTAIDRELKALDRLIEDGRPKGRLEMLCIQRQIHDLQHGHERGLYWDADEADRVERFFGLLKHYKSRFHGKPVVLEPWQSLLWIRPMFGWMREKPRAHGGLRRVMYHHTEIARKNGKTLVGSGILNQGFLADEENSPECFAVATNREQSNIVFRDSQRCLTPELRQEVTKFKHSTESHRNGGFLKPLCGETASLDGLNPSRIVYDELHASKDHEMFGVLSSAMGARDHPLLACITTAGFSRSSVCWDQRKSLIQTLEGVSRGEFLNDEFLGYIATIDEETDDWTDEGCWPKANPNIGVSLHLENLRKQCRQAQTSPEFQTNFLVKHLNSWVDQLARFLPMADYDQCDRAEPHEEREKRLAGRVAFGGFDIGVTNDLSACVLIFPPTTGDRIDGDDGFDVLAYCWAPKESPHRQAENAKRQVYEWAARGWVRLNDGNETDFGIVRRDLMKLHRMFQIRKLVYDSSFATAFTQQLQSDGFPHSRLETAGRGYSFYSEPTRKLLSLVRQRKWRHGQNPCMRWQMSNLSVKQGDMGDVMPSKDRSGDKIDIPVAGIYALHAAQDQKPKSAGFCFTV